jgi:hypothetical protein
MILALNAYLENDMFSDYGTWSLACHLGWSVRTTSIVSRVVTVERCRSIRANGRSVVGRLSRVNHDRAYRLLY